MNRSARSFVAIMVAIALAAMVLRFAVVQVISFNITQNESNAQSTLKEISTALENYAKANLGVFPSSLEILAQAQPPYIEKEYLNLGFYKGYSFDCIRLDSSGYTYQAEPIKCGLTGSKAFTITTGGSLTSQECAKAR